MYIDILSERDITYFDIPANGNYGYDGTTKMKKKKIKCIIHIFILKRIRGINIQKIYIITYKK